MRRMIFVIAVLFAGEALAGPKLPKPKYCGYDVSLAIRTPDGMKKVKSLVAGLISYQAARTEAEARDIGYPAPFFVRVTKTKCESTKNLKPSI